MIKYTVKILEIREQATGTKTYVLEKPKDLTWDEGAHTHVAHIGFDRGEKPDKSLVRHMSISSLPEEGTVNITTRVPGSGSEFKRRLAQLKEGDTLVLFKIGSRVKLRREDRPLVFLSMGVGIATIRPILKHYLDRPENIGHVISINVDRSGEPVFRDELEEISGNKIQYHWSKSRHDYYTALENSFVGNPYYWIIGSDVFIQETVKSLYALGAAREDMLIDKKEEKTEALLADIQGNTD